MTSGMPLVRRSRPASVQRPWTRGLLVALLLVAGWWLLVLVLAPDARAADPAPGPAVQTTPPAGQGASALDDEEAPPIAESAGRDDHPGPAVRRWPEARTAATDGAALQRPHEPELRPAPGTAPATAGRSADDDGEEAARPAREVPAPHRTRQRPDTVATPDADGRTSPEEEPEQKAEAAVPAEPTAAQPADSPSSSAPDPDGAPEPERAEAARARGRGAPRAGSWTEQRCRRRAHSDPVPSSGPVRHPRPRSPDTRAGRRGTGRRTGRPAPRCPRCRRGPESRLGAPARRAPPVEGPPEARRVPQPSSACCHMAGTPRRPG
jgi:hypothetical protein